MATTTPPTASANDRGRSAAYPRISDAAEERQQRLLCRRIERGVGGGGGAALAAVRRDGVGDAAGAAIVQHVTAPGDAQDRRRSPVAAAGGAGHELISQCRPHVMNQQIRIEVDGAPG